LHKGVKFDSIPHGDHIFQKLITGCFIFHSCLALFFVLVALFFVRHQYTYYTSSFGVAFK
jgi:hypothetical protein